MGKLLSRIAVGAIIWLVHVVPISAAPATSPADIPRDGPRYTPQMRAAIHAERASLFAAQANDPQALAEIEKTLKVMPEHAGALELRKRVLALQDPARVRTAADRGDLESVRLMGLVYADGRGVEKNWVTAADWLRRAAEAGNERAMRNFAGCLIQGLGVASDPAAAFRWYVKAADTGSINAAYWLTYCYRDGVGVPTDHLQAVQKLRTLAELPDHSWARGQARADLGSYLLSGRGDTVVALEGGLRWTMLAIEDGSGLAMWNLGVLFFEGKVVPKDLEAFFAWADAAVEAGHVEAANTLGLQYSRGNEVMAKSDHKAVRYFRIAAEFGHKAAMSNLAACYLEGTGVEKDEAEAYRWMKAAADAGDATAAEWIKKRLAPSTRSATTSQPTTLPSVATAPPTAVMAPSDIPRDGPRYTPQMRAAIHFNRASLFFGNTSDQVVFEELSKALKAVPDYADAIELRDRLTALQNPAAIRKAAERGDAVALCRMFDLYSQGRGVSKDQAVAVSWLRRAAEAGDLLAMRNLARAFSIGEGVERDPAAAFRWLHRAASAGCIRAAYRVSYCYTEGIGVPADPNQSIQWLKRAAESTEHSLARGEARAALGGIYLDGHGTTKDLGTGAKWTFLALEDGCSVAIWNIALMFRDGVILERDVAAFRIWADAAVEAGHVDAANKLALWYSQGTASTPKNEAKAASLFRLAAVFGHPSAMSNLASCYLEGAGVENSEAEAYRWMKAAADAGDATAAEWVRKRSAPATQPAPTTRPSPASVK